MWPKFIYNIDTVLKLVLLYFDICMLVFFKWKLNYIVTQKGYNFECCYAIIWYWGFVVGNTSIDNKYHRYLSLVRFVVNLFFVVIILVQLMNVYLLYYILYINVAYIHTLWVHRAVLNLIYEEYIELFGVVFGTLYWL